MPNIGLGSDRWAVDVLKKTEILRWSQRPAHGSTLPKLAYLPLLVPVTLFIVSLYIPPRMVIDSAVGFFVFRNMLHGGAFNTFTEPDAADIARDAQHFLSWWSPGQYLVPGSFVLLGANYGVALSLTALIATLFGVAGWIQVSRSFAASSFVISMIVLGLSTFSYTTFQFRTYHGGELLLFAVAPWSLYAMRWAVNKPPMLCFTISLVSATILFFAKLTGIVVFATNVGALSLLALVSQRRLSTSIIAMWLASTVGAICFSMFWLARGSVPASGSAFTFRWFPIWVSITGATFSGLSIVDFLGWFLGHPRIEIVSGERIMKLLTYVLGPFGLLLMAWVWLRLRRTQYRDMAIVLLTVVFLYTIAIAAMYLRGAWVSFEDRNFRYAGILFFLLLLVFIDQWPARHVLSAKSLAWIVVIVLGLYGLKASVTATYAQMRIGYYDPMTGISQDILSPGILEYMRSETTQQNFQSPVAVIPSASAAISLPRFRIIYFPGQYLTLEKIREQKWAGRAEKIFVVVQQEMLLNGKAEAILTSFTGYDIGSWKQKRLDGLIIYTQ
jgi:hypothetical protein